jgi:hypothetical protein
MAGHRRLAGLALLECERRAQRVLHGGAGEAEGANRGRDGEPGNAAAIR